MVRDVSLSWFRHGSSWFTVMVLSWFVMVRDVSLSWFCHGSSWFTVMVSSWFIMVRDVSLSWFRHGSSWFTVMVHHGSSWFTVMVRHGSSWFVMVHCHGSSWFVMVHCHGFVMVRHGSSWFVMCYSLKFSRKGHVTLYSANQGLKFTIKSHFWWDFLFCPFHLKSIPLKSSAKNWINLDLFEIIHFCLNIYDLWKHPHLWVGIWMCWWIGHSFDILTFDFLLKPSQPVTGLFLTIDILYITAKFGYSFDILTFDFWL